MSVLVETTLGDLVIDLFVKERPNCSLNFIKLCKMKYYNLCQFHQIEQDYIAQTGDPTGTGRGGDSVFSMMYGEQARFFEKEEVPKMRHTRMGLVSFVNNGEGMLGSQFFITLADGLDYLDNDHTIFGQVTEGLDTLEKLNEQLCDDDHRPFKDIRIAHTIILADPFEDPKRLEYPSRSPSPTFERIVNSNQISLDERLDDNDGKTVEEIRKEMEENEARAQAQLLEIVGDLRHADEAPPENVLFVCKLNPLTTDEDLEIIFSRFGKIECCEIIRDRRSGASLQYAFIEFDNPAPVEAAYKKMDNVLIDDRRIHVDFSQSVAKNYKWKKGQGGRADEFVAQGRTKVEREEKRKDDDRHRGVNGRDKYKREDRKDDRRDRKRQEGERSPKRHRSRSPDHPKRGVTRRERSISKERRDRKRDRSSSRDRRRDRSTSRVRRRDRSTSRDRKRDRSTSRDRKRDRSTSRGGKRSNRSTSRDASHRDRKGEKSHKKNRK